MIYEANASSSACRFWRVHLVETSTPPAIGQHMIGHFARAVKGGNPEIRPAALPFRLIFAIARPKLIAQ